MQRRAGTHEGPDGRALDQVCRAMTHAQLVTLCLPTRDLAAAARFYRGGLGFPYAANAGDDELPEPVVFVLNDAAHLMVIPTGGFGWAVGDRTVAGPDVSECIVALTVARADEVDGLLERARGAGGTIVSEAAVQEWGYAGTFTDLDGHLWEVTAPAAG
jgi:uncharacterized protein